MMNAKRTAIVLAGALGLPVLTVLPATAAPAAPDNISIDVVSINGSGCPAGTASAVFSPDRTDFTITYSDFLVSVGGNAPPTAQKNCQISLRINAPGYTYAVEGLDHQGFANMSLGASGTEQTYLTFEGSSQSQQIGGWSRGGLSVGEWIFYDWVGPRARVWKPCGEDRNLNINTVLLVKTESSDNAKMSFMSMDSTHSNLRDRFVWGPCP